MIWRTIFLSLPLIFFTFSPTFPEGIKDGLKIAMDGISRLLPDSGELEGWGREGIKFYDRSNLYEYIDGEAENFLVYKFVVAGVARYLSSSGDEMVVDIYDMGGTWDAFGRYASVKFPGAEKVKIGVEGFTNDFGLDFWKGRYYVKITVFKKEERLISEVQRFGKLIASRIEGEDKPPIELSLFPKLGMVEGSERFVRGTVVGIPDLPHGFVAQYDVKGRKFYVILSPFEKSDDAARCFGMVRKGLGKGTKGVRKKLGDESISGNMKYYGNLLLIRKGRFLIGAVGDLKGAVPILEGILKDIGKISP